MEIFNKNVIKSPETNIQYNVIKELGSGSFGKVFLVTDNSNSVKKAIKIIDANELSKNKKLFELFQTEIYIMKHYKHSNIIFLFESFVIDNKYYLVMPFCDGGSLKDYLNKVKVIDYNTAIHFLVQIKDAFIYLIGNKIMHRDIKLDNIFLKDGNIVIGDFGFAKMGYDYASTKLGTPFYSSPELLKKIGDYNNLSDLWSIGICFYEMIEGKLPFFGRNCEDLIFNINKNGGSNLKFKNCVNVTCQEFLKRCLEPNVKFRMTWEEFKSHAIFNTNNKHINNNNISTLSNYSLIDKNINKEFSSKDIIYHEINKTIFIYKIIKNLENVKGEYYSNIQTYNYFNILQCSLIKKIMLYSNYLIKSLKNNINITGMPDFDTLCKSSLLDKIISEINDNLFKYEKFYSYIIEKIKKNNNNLNNEDNNNFNNTQLSNNIDDINKIIETYNKNIFNYLFKSKYNLPDNSYKTHLSVIFLSDYCGSITTEYPKFITNNKYFYFDDLNTKIKEASTENFEDFLSKKYKNNFINLFGNCWNGIIDSFFN